MIFVKLDLIKPDWMTFLIFNTVARLVDVKKCVWLDPPLPIGMIDPPFHDEVRSVSLLFLLLLDSMELFEGEVVLLKLQGELFK